MPELPEVETIVSGLAPALIDRRIEGVHVFRTDVIRPPGLDLNASLLSRKVVGLTRRGKKIVFELDNGSRFFIHLGMSGRLSLEEPAAALRPHTHLIVEIAQHELRFVDPRRFGGVFWLGNDQPADTGLGPEPLTMTAAELRTRLAKTRRAIKTALLDQKMVAGVGNIYADEALFEARIDPRLPSNRLSADDVTRLTRAIKKVLKRAIRHRGSTLRDYRDSNGKPGNFQKVHRVYGREGQPCLRCGTPVVRIVLGGRSTHFCRACQRNPKGPKPSKA